LHQEVTDKLKAERESLRQRLVQAEGDVMIERRARIRLEAEFTELERRMGVAPVAEGSALWPLQLFRRVFLGAASVF
jgi:hypothetical protein